MSAQKQTMSPYSEYFSRLFSSLALMSRKNSREPCPRKAKPCRITVTVFGSSMARRNCSAFFSKAAHTATSPYPFAASALTAVATCDNSNSALWRWSKFRARRQSSLLPPAFCYCCYCDRLPLPPLLLLIMAPRGWCFSVLNM